MSYINYEDPILNQVISVLNEFGPLELKNRYGTGDPGIINKSELMKPMVFLSFNDAQVSDASSSHLKVSGTIVINVVHDMTKDFGQGLKAKSHNAVVGLLMGMVFDTERGYYIRDNTIVGAIRMNQDMGYGLRIDLGSTSNIDFDAMTRNKGLVTTEGVLEIRASVEFLRSEFRN